MCKSKTMSPRHMKMLYLLIPLDVSACELFSSLHVVRFPFDSKRLIPEFTSPILFPAPPSVHPAYFLVELGILLCIHNFYILITKYAYSNWSFLEELPCAGSRDDCQKEHSTHQLSLKKHVEKRDRKWNKERITI